MNDLEKWFVLKMDWRELDVLQRTFWKKALQGFLLLPCLLMQLEGEKMSLFWPAEPLVLGLWGCPPAPGALVLLDCLRDFCSRSQ